jgi:hypothetical protein
MRARNFLVPAYVGVAAGSLWLRSAVLVHANGQAAYDDFLFVRLAYRLGAGLWLGPYDQLTLAKGMGYPAFILASFLAGVPLKIAEQATYLAGAGLAAWLVTRLTGKHWLAFLLFAGLAFNPVLWTPAFAHVIREGLYISLSLMVLLLAAAVLLLRRDQAGPFTLRLVLPVALGLVGGVYWLTREEGIWLLPAIAVLAGAAAVDLWRQASRDKDRAGAVRRMVRLAAAGATSGVVFAAVVGSVAGMNYVRYGAFITNEFKSASFLSAYGAISRIRHTEWQRYVVFPKEAREKAYAVSPAALELRPVLDGEYGEAVRRFACKEMRRDPCPETPGGWLMWVVRDAAAEAGHHSSARAAFAFYDRLAAEIDAACADGRLSCDPARASILPPFRWHYLGDALAVAPALLRIVTSLGDGEVGARPSIGYNFVIEFIEALVGRVSRPATQSMVWQATATAVDPPEVFVRDRSGAPFIVHLRPVTPVEPPAGKETTSVEVETDCLRATCDLVVRSGAHEHVFPISSVSEKDVSSAGAIDVSIIRFGNSPSVSRNASEKLRDRQLALAHGIAIVYAAVMPVLSVLASLGLLFAMLMRRRHPLHEGLVALALACAVAVACRVAMLAYISVTWIPIAVNLAYASPATPFLVVFVVLGLYLGGVAVQATLSRRRPARDQAGQPTR